MDSKYYYNADSASRASSSSTDSGYHSRSATSKDYKKLVVKRGTTRIVQENARGYDNTDPYVSYIGAYGRRGPYQSRETTQKNTKVPDETKLDERGESLKESVPSDLCLEEPSGGRDLQDDHTPSKVPTHYDLMVTSTQGSEHGMLPQVDESYESEDLDSSHVTASSKALTTSNTLHPSEKRIYTDDSAHRGVTCENSDSSSSQPRGIVSDPCNDHCDLPSTRSRRYYLPEEISASLFEHGFATWKASSKPTSSTLGLGCSDDSESETRSAFEHNPSNDSDYKSNAQNISSSPGGLGDALRELFDDSKSSTSSNTNAEPQPSSEPELNLDHSANTQSLLHLQEKISKLTVSDNVTTKEHPTATETGNSAEGHEAIERRFSKDIRLQAMSPERSRRVQLIIQRLTESVHSQYKADNVPFREHTAPCGYTADNNSTSPKSGKETTQSIPDARRSQRPDKKRKLSQSPNGGESDEEQSTSDDPKGKQKEPRPRLACPFFKHDRSRYGDRRCWRECSGPGWPDMHRLKEHLFRKHKKARHCRRCWATFKKDEALMAHQRENPPCPVLEEVPIEGLDAGQEGKLRARKTFVKMEECTKWRTAYVIIFPGVAEDQIPLPYYVREDFCDFPFDESSENLEAYLRRELPARMTDILVNRMEGLHVDYRELKELCNEVVHQALDGRTRSTHEHARPQYEPSLPVAQVIGESSSTVITQLDEQPRRQAVSSTFNLEANDLEDNFGPSFWDDSIDQLEGFPALDFLSEHPGWYEDGSPLGNLGVTKEISDSGYDSLPGAGSQPSPPPQ